MSSSNLLCPIEYEPTYQVVETVCTFNKDGYWFRQKHQYTYVRSEVQECDKEFIGEFTHCLHHIVHVDDREIAIPESIGILTDMVRSDITQDTLLYLEQKYSDGIKERWEAYKRYLPIGENDETRGKVMHSMGWYKEYLENKLGE